MSTTTIELMKTAMFGLIAGVIGILVLSAAMQARQDRLRNEYMSHQLIPIGQP